MTETTWVEISPDDVREDDRVLLGAWGFSVMARSSGMVELRDDEDEALWTNISALTFLGAVFERKQPKHPHGLVPTEEGTVVRITESGGRGWLVLERSKAGWFPAAPIKPDYTDAEVQMLANRYGFEVLWPRPNPEQVEITDGMVVRAAKAMCDNSNGLTWAEETDGTTKEIYIGDARVALEAVLGGDE